MDTLFVQSLSSHNANMILVPAYVIRFWESTALHTFHIFLSSRYTLLAGLVFGYGSLEAICNCTFQCASVEFKYLNTK